MTEKRLKEEIAWQKRLGELYVYYEITDGKFRRYNIRKSRHERHYWWWGLSYRLGHGCC